MMKKIINYKYITIVLIILSLFVSFIWELTFSNYHYYRYDFKGEEQINNLNYQNEDNNLIVFIKTDKKYIHELNFKVNEPNLENKNYEIYYQDDNNNFIKLSDNVLYSKYDGIVAMPIHKETREIKLVFSECNNLKLENISVTNNFQINYLRVFINFVIIYLVLDLIKIFWGSKKPQLHLYFLKVAILIGFSFALISPLFYPYDENHHMIRSYNNSYGNLILSNNKL